MFEIRIVLRELQRPLVIGQRVGDLAAPLIDLRHRAVGGEIVGSGGEDDRQLGLRLVEMSELGERAAEGDAGREIIGVIREAGAADAHGLFVFAGAAALFSELRKSNRRRVRLDPASQFEKRGLSPLTATYGDEPCTCASRRATEVVTSRDHLVADNVPGSVDDVRLGAG